MSRRKTMLLAVLFVGIAGGIGWLTLGNGGDASSPNSEGEPMTHQDRKEKRREKKVLVSPLGEMGWHVGSEASLRKEIAALAAPPEVKPLPSVCALILPHAGYTWSGETAAYGQRAIEGSSYERVIVLGPSHRWPLENIASLPDATHFATPLGELEIDTETVEALRQFPEFQGDPEALVEEHSIAIEIPLLQYTLPPFRLVPILVGHLDREAEVRMAQILRSFVDAKTLVVASSDFTHYGLRFGYLPFRDSIEANLRTLDLGAAEEIEKKNPDGFRAYCDRTGATICGRFPIGVLLRLLPPSAQAHRLRYDTSGRKTGSYRDSVSYLTIAFTGMWEKGESIAPPSPSESQFLTEEEKKALLRLARAVLESTVRGEKLPTPESLGITLTPGLKKVRGAFVTLHRKGQLRGCIGEIAPQRPLYQAVMAHAVNSSQHDPRFYPVRPEELPEIDIEISALTPPVPVSSYREIVIGRHGMTLSKHGRSAVFLPQVAPEQGWDLETTLTYLARKAGLPGDAWKEGAEFTVFEAEVFGEKEK